QAASPLSCTQPVGGRVNLHGRPTQYPRTDTNRHDIQHNTVEVEIHIVAQRDVAAVVAEKRRFDPGVTALGRYQHSEQVGAFFPLLVARVVETLEQQPGLLALCAQLGILRIVEVTVEHFFFFRRHRAVSEEKRACLLARYESALAASMGLLTRLTFGPAYPALDFDQPGSRQFALA